MFYVVQTPHLLPQIFISVLTFWGEATETSLLGLQLSGDSEREKESGGKRERVGLHEEGCQ